jgi:hypothetical protein
LSLKYGEVYLREYRSVTEASEAIDAYFCFYKEQRPHHSSLEKVPPAAVYEGTLTNADKTQRGRTAGFSRPF